MSIILNKEELLESNTELRKDALDILEAGYEAIDTGEVLRGKVMLEKGAISAGKMSFECRFYDRIFFVGIGKCAFDGAGVIGEILGDYLTDGIALDVKSGGLKKIRSYAGSHPYPSEANVSATREILKMVEGVTERDLILVLISGGGSSMFDMPTVPVDTLARITKELTNKGADIYELNTVRKHLSQVKGGQFATACFPAQVVSLIFSDVLGNDMSMVASGPTVMDMTTVEDAKKILEKYGIPLPDFIETPKDPKYFGKVKNVLVVSNRDALEAMKVKAEGLGYQTSVETEKLSGNATEIGKELASREPRPKTCILLGGETTVKTNPLSSGEGVGGRNQETALSALPNMRPGSVLVCAASDGWDNTDHAGAIVDRELFEKSQSMGIPHQEYLLQSDSYNFFKKAGGAIYTGKLGSNVSDLFIMLYK